MRCLALLVCCLVPVAGAEPVTGAEPGAEAVVGTEAGAKSDSGKAPEPLIEFLWLPPSSASDGNAHAGQNELRVRVGAPPWWRTSDGRGGSVFGAGYARIDPVQSEANLPAELKSYYVNSVSWWRWSSTLSTSLVITPGLRAAEDAFTWEDTRLFVGAFANWRLSPKLDLGFGVISTSNHRDTKFLPVATAIIRPDEDWKIWFQGIAAQVQWQATPKIAVTASYNLLASLDFQLPKNDADGEIIFTRDIRVLGGLRWSAFRYCTVGVVAGVAFNRRWQWEGEDPVRDDLRLAPTTIIGLNAFLTL